ncbi:MAG: alpha/beta hydrolase [Pseudomonadota bacterium]
MIDNIPPAVWIAGAGLVALIVFVIVWRLAGRFSFWANVLIRSILVLLVAAPIALVTLSVDDYLPTNAPFPKSMPTDSADRRGGGSAPGRPEAVREDRTKSPVLKGDEESVAAGDDRIAEQPSMPLPDDVAGIETEGAVRGPGPLNGGRTRGLTPTTASPPVSEKWTLVPVYYGTDRELKTGEDRIGYTWKRARRLEIGRAMVSVPKDHVEPRVERPWALTIPYTNIKLYEASEEPSKHFTIQEITSLSEEDFLKLVKERLAKSARFKDHALIFVHGYQTTFDNAVYRTAQITFDLKFDGAPFLYSWPSGGTLQGYTYDRESAAQSEPHLRAFLDLVVKRTGAKKVSVIAHSMGNQPLLRVLQGLKNTSNCVCGARARF